MGATFSKKKENEPQIGTQSTAATAEMVQEKMRNTVRRAGPPKNSARPDDIYAKYAEILRAKGVLPEMFLVHEAKSSEYIDEDGDVAHEFYQETMSDGEKGRLCRLMKNLRPQGKERYAIPRLKPEIPVVMWEVSSTTTQSPTS